MIEEIISFINDRISYFGSAPICNLNPSHGFFINGFCFPLCTRCTFIFIGLIVGSILFFGFINGKKIRSIYFLSILLVIPCVLDGLLQYFFKLESNNFRRILTGFLFGFGISLFIELLLFKYVFKKQYPKEVK